MRGRHPPDPYCRCNRCKLERRLDEIVSESVKRVVESVEERLAELLTPKDRP